jgi:hypothetical protein
MNDLEDAIARVLAAEGVEICHGASVKLAVFMTDYLQAELAARRAASGIYTASEAANAEREAQVFCDKHDLDRNVLFSM